MFRGEDGETREPVVIKVVRVGLTPERAAVVGAALASLRDRVPSHPALAACFDVGVVDVEPYVVSAYVDGDSLDVALREYGPALLVDAVPRLRLLADGLDLAAAAGISHGSLHPRDILVAVEHTVLQGLGLAGVLERVGVRPPVRRPYCAPEVALGRGISPAGDQYSLAAVAHEWLTGRRIAAGQDQAVRVPGLTGDAAEMMRAVFARALAESPDDRFPSASAFVEAMAELAPPAAGRPKPSRRPPAAAPPRLSFDEPDEPAAPQPPPAAAAAAASAGPGRLHEALDDDLEDRDDLVVQSQGPTAAMLDLPILPETPGPAAVWDENPLREFSAAPDDGTSARGGRDDAAGDAVDDEDDVVPDDGLDVPTAPVIVTSVSAELEVDAPVLPIHEAGPTSWDDEQASPDEAPAGGDTSETAAAAGDRVWTTWVVGIVAFTLLAIGGGWALVRWGTPSAPLQGPRVAGATATPAASAVTPAPVAAPPEPMVEPSTPPASPGPAPTAARPAPRQTPAAVANRPAPAVDTARLLVRSTPGGAEVFVNGERRGVTPLALRDLPLGSYTVRITRAGYAPVDERVVLERGRPSRALEVTLARAGGATPPPAVRSGSGTGATGLLVVETRPPGARVLVDGNDVGATPVTLPSLPAGSHRIRIERPGYTPITTTTTIEAGARARVAVTLTPERP